MKPCARSSPAQPPFLLFSPYVPMTFQSLVPVQSFRYPASGPGICCSLWRGSTNSTHPTALGVSLPEAFPDPLCSRRPLIQGKPHIVLVCFLLYLIYSAQHLRGGAEPGKYLRTELELCPNARTGSMGVKAWVSCAVRVGFKSRLYGMSSVSLNKSISPF